MLNDWTYIAVDFVEVAVDVEDDVHIVQTCYMISQ